MKKDCKLSVRFRPVVHRQIATWCAMTGREIRGCVEESIEAAAFLGPRLERWIRATNNRMGGRDRQKRPVLGTIVTADHFEILDQLAGKRRFKKREIVMAGLAIVLRRQGLHLQPFDQGHFLTSVYLPRQARIPVPTPPTSLPTVPRKCDLLLDGHVLLQATLAGLNPNRANVLSKACLEFLEGLKAREETAAIGALDLCLCVTELQKHVRQHPIKSDLPGYMQDLTHFIRGVFASVLEVLPVCDGDILDAAKFLTLATEDFGASVSVASAQRHLDSSFSIVVASSRFSAFAAAGLNLVAPEAYVPRHGRTPATGPKFTFDQSDSEFEAAIDTKTLRAQNIRIFKRRELREELMARVRKFRKHKGQWKDPAAYHRESLKLVTDIMAI